MDFITHLIRFFAKWPAVLAIACALGFFAREYRHHPKKFFQEVSITTVTVLVAWGISAILKIIVHAPRPFVGRGIPNAFMVQDYTSFPSGHATLFFAIATAVFLYNRKTGSLLYLFATVIAVFRVIAGIHYPIDVVVGAGIGVGIAYLVHSALSKVFRK